MPNITISNNEYRTCMVGNRKALFHRWIEKNSVFGLKDQYLMGLVEYENGELEEVNHYKIRFCDNKIREYDYSEIDNHIPRID